MRVWSFNLKSINQSITDSIIQNVVSSVVKRQRVESIFSLSDKLFCAMQAQCKSKKFKREQKREEEGVEKRRVPLPVRWIIKAMLSWVRFGSRSDCYAVPLLLSSDRIFTVGEQTARTFLASVESEMSGCKPTEQGFKQKQGKRTKVRTETQTWPNHGRRSFTRESY